MRASDYAQAAAAASLIADEIRPADSDAVDKLNHSRQLAVYHLRQAARICRECAEYTVAHEKAGK